MGQQSQYDSEFMHFPFMTGNTFIPHYISYSLNEFILTPWSNKKDSNDISYISIQLIV